MKICLVGGCGKPLLAKGLCGMHYMRVRTTGTTDTPFRPRIVGVAKCSVNGCEKRVQALGLCAMHWLRQKKYGITDAHPRKSMSAEQRFWQFVVKDGPIMSHMDTPCWDWNGSKGTYGYGRVQSRGNTPRIASRLSYELHFGAIPHGLCVLHRCDNPVCTRPDHLFLGTMKENTQDMLRKRRHSHGQNHPLAKLTDTVARDIKHSASSGRSIALELGVSRSLITAIRRGQRWTHIE